MTETKNKQKTQGTYEEGEQKENNNHNQRHEKNTNTQNKTEQQKPVRWETKGKQGDPRIMKK